MKSVLKMFVIKINAIKTDFHFYLLVFYINRNIQKYFHAYKHSLNFCVTEISLTYCLSTIQMLYCFFSFLSVAQNIIYNYFHKLLLSFGTEFMKKVQ